MGAWGAPQGQAPAPTQWPNTSAPFGATTPGQPPTYGYGGSFTTNEMVAPTPLDTQTYLISSILVLLFCCQPAGIMGIIWSEEAKKLHAQGRFDDAQKKLSNAKLALIIGPILGVFFGTIYVVIQVLANL